MVLGLFDKSCVGPMGNWDLVTGKRCARTAALLCVALFVALVTRVYDSRPLLLFLAPLVYLGVYEYRIAMYKKQRRVTFA